MAGAITTNASGRSEASMQIAKRSRLTVDAKRISRAAEKHQDADSHKKSTKPVRVARVEAKADIPNASATVPGRGKKSERKSGVVVGGPPQTKSSSVAPIGASSFRPAPLPHAASALDFSRRLRRWFQRNGRDLPWRRTRDPYRVLVSELMLQQTQVSRVVDYYARFLTRFPSLSHLAESPQEHVLDAWSGLGYYARARNLHALALHVTRDGGIIPSDAESLRQLPGIGAYTAGAVSSFAYEQRAALVDTNVARVLARAFAPDRSPKRPRDLTQLWRIAESILPRRGKDAWTHNQAIMELGALVCTARIAYCDRCPVSALCLTRQRELVAIERAERRVAGSTQRAIGIEGRASVAQRAGKKAKSGKKRLRSLPPIR